MLSGGEEPERESLWERFKERFDDPAEAIRLVIVIGGLLLVSVLLLLMLHAGTNGPIRLPDD